MLMPTEDNKKKEYPQNNKEQNVEEDQSDLVGENLDNKTVRDILPKSTLWDRLFASEFTSFL